MVNVRPGARIGGEYSQGRGRRNDPQKLVTNDAYEMFGRTEFVDHKYTSSGSRFWERPMVLAGELIMGQASTEVRLPGGKVLLIRYEYKGQGGGLSKITSPDSEITFDYECEDSE